MKPALIGVAALVLGLAGGTGVTVMKHKKLAAQVVEIEQELEKHGKKDAKHGEDGATADSTAQGDSTAAHGEAAGAHADSTAAPHDAPATPSAMPAAALTAAPASAHDGEAHAAKPADAVKSELPAAKLAGKGEVRPASAPSATNDAAARAQGFKQLGRIFASMKAEDAAKVMALMTDDEVEGVLRSLGPKEAANMIGQLPKERAAALSRRLLVATIK